MLIKILCSCGTKFSFDVEPVRGRMPVPVSCPSCGTDATSQANERLSESIASECGQAATAAPVAQIISTSPPAPTPAAKPIRIATPPATQPPSASAEATPPSRLSIRQPATPAQASGGSAPEGRLCPKHQGQPAVEACHICGRPICRKCMQMFGYVCSVYCRDKAEASGQHVPVYAGQKSAVEKKARAKSRALVAACMAVVALLVAAWMWYAFVGSKPRVVYSQRLPESISGGIIKLMEPGQHLIISSRKVVLFDEKDRKEIWSASLDEPATAIDGEDDDEDYFSLSTGVRVLAEKPDLWLLAGDRLLCLGLESGERKHESKIAGRVTDLFAVEETVSVISADYGVGGLEKRLAIRINLADGKIETQDLVFPGSEAVRSRDIRLSGAISPPIQTVSGPYPGDFGDNLPIKVSDRVEVAAAGPNVVQCEIKVIEPNVIVREAIKKKDNPLLESGRMNASRSLEAAEELLNELKRSDDGGRVYEDASKYRVTLRRLFAPGAEPWTGEVTGGVSFFPLATVDLLVAGKSLHVFDKQNRKRWDSSLTYGISPAFTELGGGDRAPGIEHDGTLYFFDQGMLTAFDLNSGEVRWRVTSVWISRVVPDGEGNLYVSSTTASPEDIQYSKQLKVFDRVEPILMKVHAGSGEVKWKVPRAGDACYVSGKYVYGVRSASPLFSMLNPNADHSIQFFLNRLNPRNGKIVWTYRQPRMPEHLDFQGRTILLQFSDELQVLNYLSL